MKRDWKAAREKVDQQACRVCGDFPPDRLPVRRREADRFLALDSGHYETRLSAGSVKWRVSPLRIAPLCPTHHRAYDSHELDLLPYLTAEEQAQAVLDAGSLEQARVRLAPSAYENKVASHG